jgi:hypothetical protein
MCSKSHSCASRMATIEREMKRRWVNYFKSDVHVAVAYLAKVRYGDSPEQKVALCLSANGTERRTLVERVSSDFRRPIQDDGKPRYYFFFARAAAEASLGGQAVLPATPTSNIRFVSLENPC